MPSHPALRRLRRILRQDRERATKRAEAVKELRAAGWSHKAIGEALADEHHPTGYTKQRIHQWENEA